MQVKVISIILIFSIFLNITGCGTSSNNINNTETKEKHGLAPLIFLKYWGLSLLSLYGVIIIGEVVQKGSGVGIAIVGTGLLFVSIPIYFVYWIINGIVYYND
jgi:hypothetical protein